MTEEMAAKLTISSRLLILLYRLGLAQRYNLAAKLVGCEPPRMRRHIVIKIAPFPLVGHRQQRGTVAGRDHSSPASINATIARVHRCAMTLHLRACRFVML